MLAICEALTLAYSVAVSSKFNYLISSATNCLIEGTNGLNVIWIWILHDSRPDAVFPFYQKKNDPDKFERLTTTQSNFEPSINAHQ